MPIALLALALCAPPAVAPPDPELAAARLLARAAAAEPTIEEVQRAAAREAVRGDLPPGAARRARLSALLPKVGAEYVHEDKRLHVLGLTSSSEVDYLRHTPGDALEVRLSWDLAAVGFSEVELRLAAEREKSRKARAEAVERATKLYYERQRLRLALVALPPSSARERAEKELDLAELGAALDALTGGLYARGAR